MFSDVDTPVTPVSTFPHVHNVIHVYCISLGGQHENWTPLKRVVTADLDESDIVALDRYIKLVRCDVVLLKNFKKEVEMPIAQVSVVERPDDDGGIAEKSEQLRFEFTVWITEVAYRKKAKKKQMAKIETKAKKTQRFNESSGQTAANAKRNGNKQLKKRLKKDRSSLDKRVKKLISKQYSQSRQKGISEAAVKYLEQAYQISCHAATEAEELEKLIINVDAAIRAGAVVRQVNHGSFDSEQKEQRGKSPSLYSVKVNGEEILIDADFDTAKVYEIVAALKMTVAISGACIGILERNDALGDDQVAKRVSKIHSIIKANLRKNRRLQQRRGAAHGRLQAGMKARIQRVPDQNRSLRQK